MKDKVLLLLLSLFCSKKQTNKHVLSNCASPVALERYRWRHDHVQSILTAWIATVLNPGRVLHVDLNTADYKPTTDVFHSLRPDIVIVNQNIIVTLELTICHESNLKDSKLYKTNKYLSLFDHLTDKYANCTASSHSLQLSSQHLALYLTSIHFVETILQGEYLM